jgi:hypothetical protein
MIRNNIKKNALIGYSGFVGSNLRKKFLNANLYNSKNIYKIKKKFFNIVICAGIPAEKWKANKYPNKDLKNIKGLIKLLKYVECKVFILISTIDVHNSHESYGKNRKFFENFVKKNFSNFLIIRLPAIFGEGIKKNILFDLLNNNQINNINPKDKFQWFDLKFLYSEIKKIKKFNQIVELYSPPILNESIIKEFNDLKLSKKNRKRIIYNYLPINGYFKDKKFILDRIRKFIKNYKKNSK